MMSWKYPEDFLKNYFHIRRILKNLENNLWHAFDHVTIKNIFSLVSYNFLTCSLYLKDHRNRIALLVQKFSLPTEKKKQKYFPITNLLIKKKYFLSIVNTISFLFCISGKISDGIGKWANLSLHPVYKRYSTTHRTTPARFLIVVSRKLDGLMRPVVMRSRQKITGKTSNPFVFHQPALSLRKWKWNVQFSS